MNRKSFIFFGLVIYFIKISNGHIFDFFKSFEQYFGFSRNEEMGTNLQTLEVNVPYEVSTVDENFISESIKLTGVSSISQLDTCQHRVIYKLKTSCHGMNDEELAKVAVMLLNCQSWVEGRKIYPCAENMSIRDCTKDMDPDAWNSYHLITNRARAVCYSVRQNQFRGLTELTVNRLMEAAKQQLQDLNKISEQQDQLHQVAQDGLASVNQAHEKILNRQENFYKAQLHGQIAIENNIRRISDEKKIILEAHNQLTELTKSVKTKLNDAAKQIEKQVDESKENHVELIEDLDVIRQKTDEIFTKIEKSIELLTTQNQLAQEQYFKTLNQLSEFNTTIYYLVSLVNLTKKTVEERLSWLTSTLGGTDMVIDKLYAILWHSLFLLVSMIACAFFSAYFAIRFVVATLPVFNLFLTLQKIEYALDPFELVISLTAFIISHVILFGAIEVFHKCTYKSNVPMLTKTEFHSTEVEENNFKPCDNPERLKSRIADLLKSPIFNDNHQNSVKKPDEHYEDEEDFGDLTPLRTIDRSNKSRTPLTFANGLTKRFCGAITRKGTPCKIMSLPGREFCSKHQNGDSVITSC